MKTRYTVDVLRSGQPRPYADHVNEYLITCEMMRSYGDKAGEFEPWVMLLDVEERIKRDEEDRAAGRLVGGTPPDGLRKQQRDWAKSIVRTLCKEFREAGDDDGREGTPSAYFYPTLSSLTIDAKAGTIRAVIITPYAD